MPAHLSRAQALGLIGLIWAAIYLPGLGTLEIKGEEGRRILPGITMLATGNWIVPSVGGVDYFSKPPLINWAIAAAVRVSGRQNEWAARAPSALCVLALGAGTVWLLADWLGGAGALLAAIFMLTGIGMMEKGRLAEIEAMYISWSGLAIVSWLALWRRTRTASGEARRERGAIWLAWTVPWLFLGLGLLTKGPMHLLFFYATAVGVLLAARSVRELWTWPHLAGVVWMLAIFAAWAVPYLRLTAGERVGQIWGSQMANRFEIDEGFRAGMWALNIPRGLANFVPWVVLLPVLWRRGTMEAAESAGPGAAADWAILRGGRWALAACFLFVSLAPGSLPRYTLPLLVPASVLLALVCARERVFGELPGWLPTVWARTLAAFLVLAGIGAGVAAWTGGGGWRWPAAAALAAACAWLIVRGGRLPLAGSRAIPALAVVSAVAMAVFTLDYVIGAVPRLLSKERLRPLAAHLNQVVGPGAPIYAYQPGFLPIFFYLHPSAQYTQRIRNLPASARYLLVYEKDYPLVFRELGAGGFLAQRALTLDHLSRGTWYVLRLERAAGR
jgi:4-amino-4-deoxy-L-arabinose transferase-like glycosyltransferase